ncbi:MAG: hypothetical protein JW912_04765 [Sedimentisphaerales bacterium]|nr:hypothetical protein [Sedimentisphaerales bacterium]
MKKIHITDEYRSMFEAAGLRSYKEFFKYSGGELINKNKKRDVTRLTFDHQGKPKHFFMKRFFYPHLKDMIFTFSNFGHICSQAACEWKNAELLFENEIGTYKPVCYGENLSWGFEKSSFFMTEEIEGICLTDFISANWGSLSQSEKENIVISIGKLCRKIHNAGISMPDLYLWHFFIKERSSDQKDYEFAVIDLHRMSKNAGKGALYRSLAALDFSLSPKYFDDYLRELLLESYMSDNYPYNRGELLRNVAERSAVLAARRRRHVY